MLHEAAVKGKINVCKIKYRKGRSFLRISEKKRISGLRITYYGITITITYYVYQKKTFKRKRKKRITYIGKKEKSSISVLSIGFLAWTPAAEDCTIFACNFG